MSQFGAPVLPPFGHPAQSMGYGEGSEYGGMQMPMQTGQMQMPPMAPMPYQMTGGSMYGMPGMQGMQGMQGMPMMPQHTGSAYGAAPMSMMMMGNPGMGMGMGGNFDGSQSGMDPPSMARPMSTFSMATTANLFTGPSQSTDPTEDELFNALRLYLSTQDLMTVTKKCVFSFLL
jgi:chitin synthase